MTNQRRITLFASAPAAREMVQVLEASMDTAGGTGVTITLRGVQDGATREPIRVTTKAELIEGFVVFGDIGE